jgi:hypothetical protein
MNWGFIEVDCSTLGLPYLFHRSGEVAACVADVASVEQLFTPEAVIQLLSSYELRGQASSSTSTNAATKRLPLDQNDSYDR